MRSRAIGVHADLPRPHRRDVGAVLGLRDRGGPADPVTGIAVGVEALDELIAVGPRPKTHLDARRSDRAAMWGRSR